MGWYMVHPTSPSWNHVVQSKSPGVGTSMLGVGHPASQHPSLLPQKRKGKVFFPPASLERAVTNSGKCTWSIRSLHLMQVSPGHLAKALDHESVRNTTLKDCSSPINLHDGEPTHQTLPPKLEQFQTYAKFCSTTNFYSQFQLCK